MKIDELTKEYIELRTKKSKMEKIGKCWGELEELNL